MNTIPVTGLPVEQWLQSLPGELPCGPDLEYDPNFLALEQAASGRPDVQLGSTFVAAVAPDWKAVSTLGREVMARSRDLRVAAHLTRAELTLRGIAGFAQALSLIEGLLADHWQHVHPQLDPHDGHDPAARVNALALLVD